MKWDPVLGEPSPMVKGPAKRGLTGYEAAALGSSRLTRFW